MEKIVPIKDRKQACLLMEKLRDFGEKYYLIFFIGVNSGMRMDEILGLTVGDPAAKDERCLKKTNALDHLDAFLISNISVYIREEGLRKGEPLFGSKKERGKNPICKTQFYRVLRKCALELGMPGIGTQTMRKTFGWMHYQENGDLAALRRILGKRTIQATADYIGASRGNSENTTLVHKLTLQENECHAI